MTKLKMQFLPSLCAECAEYVEARIDAGKSGFIFCDHGENNAGAGMLAIVRVQDREISQYTMRWPVTKSDADDLGRRLDSAVTVRASNLKPKH